MRRAMSGLLVLLVACTETPGKTTTPGASAGDTGDTGGDVASLAAAAVDIDRLLDHLDALQAIADAHDGNRQASTDGHAESAAYVAGVLEAAGYAVAWQEFSYTTWTDLGGSTLVADGVDYADQVAPLGGSISGDVSGNIVPVDVIVPISGGENTSTSGCSAEDFADFPAGSIALLQRGSCTFLEKAQRAQAAGAVAVVVFNEGQSGRRGVVEGSMGADTGLTIPVLGASYDLGETLVEAWRGGGTIAGQVVSSTLLEVRPTWNLLADLPGSGDEIVVVGAHLDSVQAGPGINDNGSGSALVLELALLARQHMPTPTNTLRFAWWGAEEAGLLGSYAYIDALTEAERDRHLANLNFDMVASPNGGLFVYDGDASDTVGYPPPAGSDLIEDLFTGFFDAEGLHWEPTAFDGRSDYGPFIAVGIPAGGLFSGAEQQKSAIEAKQWGGERDEAYDACYHQGCDTTQNIDPVLFLDHARAAASATQDMADLTSLGSSSTARRSHAALNLPRPTHHACGGAPEPSAAVR